MKDKKKQKTYATADKTRKKLITAARKTFVKNFLYDLVPFKEHFYGGANKANIMFILFFAFFLSFY